MSQRRRKTRVFPAPAGINRSVEILETDPDGVPRASGDKPEVARTKKNRFECSPRQRG